MKIDEKQLLWYRMAIEQSSNFWDPWSWRFVERTLKLNVHKKMIHNARLFFTFSFALMRPPWRNTKYVQHFFVPVNDKFRQEFINMNMDKIFDV